MTFAGPVGDSALSPSSYRIEKLDNQGNVISSVAVGSSVFVGNQRTVVAVTTPNRSAGLYRLATTSTLTDVSGSPVPVVQHEFQGVGSSVQLVGATSSNPTAMLLTFNVSMSDDVLSPVAYEITNSVGMALPVVTVHFVGTERRVVQLTTSQQSGGTYTIQSITASDIHGNAVSSISSTGVLQGVSAPSLNNAVATDTTHIYLTFAGPVGDSALSPSSYLINKLDAQGNPIGNLSVSSAAFVGNQRTVIAITTPSQTDGQYRLSTTSSLTDVSGSSVPSVQLDFQGLGSQARLVAVSSTSINTMIVTFSMPMSDDALSPSLYVIKDSDDAQLPVHNVQFIGTEHRVVQLTTAPQTSQSYTVFSINATDVGGSTTIIPTSTTINTFPGPATSGGSAIPVDAPPRVVGAASLSNTSVLIAFSEPMADNVLNTAHYFIIQQNVNPEVGFVPILSAAFNSDDRRSVLLTTASQNELTYAVTALNVTDLAGTALASAVLAGGQRIDPSTAQFPGTPPSGTQIVDTDGDGLSDNVEVRGWTVTVTLLNGNQVTREVTSDPSNPDADGDGLWDAQELNIGTDPRAPTPTATSSMTGPSSTKSTATRRTRIVTATRSTTSSSSPSSRPRRSSPTPTAISSTTATRSSVTATRVSLTCPGRSWTSVTSTCNSMCDLVRVMPKSRVNWTKSPSPRSFPRVSPEACRGNIPLVWKPNSNRGMGTEANEHPPIPASPHLPITNGRLALPCK